MPKQTRRQHKSKSKGKAKKSRRVRRVKQRGGDEVMPNCPKCLKNDMVSKLSGIQAKYYCDREGCKKEFTNTY